MRVLQALLREKGTRTRQAPLAALRAPSWMVGSAYELTSAPQTQPVYDGPAQAGGGKKEGECETRL